MRSHGFCCFGILPPLRWRLVPPASAQTGRSAALQSDLRGQLALAGPARRRLRLRRERQTGAVLRTGHHDARAPASVEKLYTATAALRRMGPTARLTTSVYGVGQLRAGRHLGRQPVPARRRRPDVRLERVHRLPLRGHRRERARAGHAAGQNRGIHHITGSSTAMRASSTPDAASPPATTRPTLSWKATLSGAGLQPRHDRGRARRPRPRRLRRAGAVGRAERRRRQHPRLERRRRPRRPVRCCWRGSHRRRSPQLLGLMLPPSDNFFAETLVKDLGALYGGAGTTARGREGRRKRRSRRCFGFTPRVVDGSGLSRADHTSPYQVVDLLAGLAGTPTGQVLREARWPSRATPGRSKNGCATPARRDAARARRAR